MADMNLIDLTQDNEVAGLCKRCYITLCSIK